MNIRIDKGSEIPIRRQLSEQIVFQIATGRVKSGDPLPSVRELSLRLKISPTTVSEAYQDLSIRLWIKRHRGKKMVVRAADRPLESGDAADLDDVIDTTIRIARERGYTLQDLRQRVRERMLIEHPDRILIVEEEAGMQELLHKELAERLPVATESVSLETLAENPGLVFGSLIVCLPGRVWRIASLLPRGHPLLVLKPSTVDEHLSLIRNLKNASVIGVVSLSPYFLALARTLLAPFAGSVHAIEEYRLEQGKSIDLSALDLVFCDNVSRASIKARRVIPHPVVCDSAIQEISSRIIRSYEPKTAEQGR
jgi:GntR family transcriptional regulator